MRRAFTLLELLTVVAVLGTMAAAGVLAVSRGTADARMKGAARDVFAAIRQARSVALLSGEPSVITFGTDAGADGAVASSVEIESTEFRSSATVARPVEDFYGEWKRLGGDESGDEGESVEETLFSPVSSETLEGIALKVVVDGDETDGGFEEQATARTQAASAFSNVDFLLGAYREAREKRESEKAAATENAAGGADAEKREEENAARNEGESRSIVWQANGRCTPHTVYVYPAGKDPLREGWAVRVDRFGAARVVSPGEDGR